MTTPEPTNPSELFTPFLPTTFPVPEEEDRLRTYLTDNFANFADVINDKKIGVFVQAIETFNGEKWWYKTTQINRNGYQAIAYIPSFINGLVLTRDTIPQYPIPNVNNELIMTMVYGTASLPPTTPGTGDYFSFMAQGDARISFTMSDTTLTITTDGARTAYSGFIVCQYVRNGL